LVVRQEGHPACKKWVDAGGWYCLVRMEWHPAGWLVCLPLLVFSCTIKSRSSLLALAHPGGPGKRAVKQLWCGVVRKIVDEVVAECYVKFVECGRLCTANVLELILIWIRTF